MKLRNKILFGLLAFFIFVIVPLVGTGAYWIRNVGLLPSTAVVFSDDAAAIDKMMANVFHSIYGDRCALCNSVDDQVEIQAAIDACPNGGTIHLAGGLYNLSAGLILPVDGIVLTGDAGRQWQTGNTVLKLAPGANATMITVRGECCMLQDFWLDGDKDNQGAGAWHGVHIEAGNVDFRARGVYVYKTKDKGWYVESSLAWFNDCLAEFCGGIGFHSVGIRILNFGFYSIGNSGNGYQIGGQTSLTACVSVDDEQNGVQIGGADVNIIGCHIINPSQGTHNLYSGIKQYSLRGSIIGNTIYVDSATKPKYGIEELGAADNNTITGNHITGAATRGISIIGAGTRAYDRYSDLFMDVLAVSANHIVNGQLLVNGAVAIANQPKYARELDVVITEVGGAVTGYTMTIVGVDAKGSTVTEVFTFTDDGLTFEYKPLITVTSITLADVVDAGNATFDVGIGGKLGLKNTIYETSDVYMITKNHAKQAVAGAQVDVNFDAYDMAAVIGLAATDDFEIWYRSNLNIIN